MGDRTSHRGHGSLSPGQECDMAWRANPYCLVWIESHSFSCSFLFWPIFHYSLSSSGQPQSVSLARVAEGPAKTPERSRCLFRARNGWGGLGECKALENSSPGIADLGTAPHRAWQGLSTRSSLALQSSLSARQEWLPLLCPTLELQVQTRSQASLESLSGFWYRAAL